MSTSTSRRLAGGNAAVSEGVPRRWAARTVSRVLLVASAGLATLLLATPALAAPASVQSAAAPETPVNFQALQLNGDASLPGTGIRLTAAAGNRSGSAFSRWPLTLADGGSFSTSFSFRMSNPGGIGAADGIAFVIQPNTNAALGVGGSIGYTGIGRSVAVEFDTWHNPEYSDPNANHIGIDTNGSVVSTVTADPGWTMASSAMNYAWINYDGVTHRLEVRASNTPSRPATPTLACEIDLAALCGQSVFAGFTAATGSGWQYHDITSWNLSLGTPTSITIKTSATTARIGQTPTLSGSVTPTGSAGMPVVVYVRKPGSARWTYSSNRIAYAAPGTTAWLYKYTFKPGMAKGVYTFKAAAPAPGFAASSGFLPSFSQPVSIRVR
jgi:hypothetical protein